MSEFWLNEEQFELLPDKVRGVARVDDRRVISGIIHVVKSGGRWVDAPACYGPRKTLYNRFVRWAAKGGWQELFVTLAAAGRPPAEVLIVNRRPKRTPYRRPKGTPPSSGVTDMMDAPFALLAA